MSEYALFSESSAVAINILLIRVPSLDFTSPFFSLHTRYWCLIFFYKRDFCIDTQANIKLFTLNRAALLWTQFIYSLKFLSLNSPTLINFTMITSYFFLGQRLHVLQRYLHITVNSLGNLSISFQRYNKSCKQKLQIAQLPPVFDSFFTFSFFNFSVGFAGSHIASHTLFLSSAQKSFIKQTLDALRWFKSSILS